MEKKFFTEISDKSNAYIKDIKFLCSKLLCTSNFFDKHFIYVAACINSIEFFINQTIHKLIENISTQNFYHYLTAPLDSLSVIGTSVIHINPNTLRKTININCINLLENQYNKAYQVYKKFLSKEMEERHVRILLKNLLLREINKWFYVMGKHKWLTCL